MSDKLALNEERAAVPAPQYSLNDLYKMAQLVAKSRLFGITRAEEAAVLMLIAQAEGRHPAWAMREYYIVDGRPALRADAMLSRFQSAGGRVEWHEITDTRVSATFTHPAGGSARITWTLEDARRAGLIRPTKSGKPSNWDRYPRQMLRARVISEGVRTVYPGVAVGIYTPEEVVDFDDDRPKTIPARVVDTQPAPAQAAEPQPASEPAPEPAPTPEPAEAAVQPAPQPEPEPAETNATPNVAELQQRVIAQLSALGLTGGDGMSLAEVLAAQVLGLDEPTSPRNLEAAEMQMFSDYLADLIRAGNSIGMKEVRAKLPGLIRAGRLPAPDAEGLRQQLAEIE